MTIEVEVPETLKKVPNTPLSQQTMEELNKEYAYWDYKVCESTGPASAGAAANFRDNVKREIYKRKASHERTS